MNKQTSWAPLQQIMKNLVWDEGREREREIPASTAKSWCQGMLMDIVYVVSSE